MLQDLSSAWALITMAFVTGKIAFIQKHDRSNNPLPPAKSSGCIPSLSHRMDMRRMIYFPWPCTTLAIRTSPDDHQLLACYLAPALVTHVPTNCQGNLVSTPGVPIAECTRTKLLRSFLCLFSASGIGALGSPSILMALKWNYGNCVWLCKTLWQMGGR